MVKMSIKIIEDLYPLDMFLTVVSFIIFAETVL